MKQHFPLGLLLGSVFLLASAGDAQLSPAMQMDLYAVEAERHSESGHYASALAALDRVLALQAEHDLTLPEAFWFQYAQVARQAERYADAVEAVTRYLTTVGQEGEHYRAALKLLDRAQTEARMAEIRQKREQRRREEVGGALATMEFVLIEAGSFAMGSEDWGHSEQPVHQVTLSQPFSLGKYEVTQGQWEAVMGSNPSHFSDCGRTCPVEQVSFWDVEVFLGELNRWGDGATYRLPTEAEWEYAARAGTQTVYHFGDDAAQLGAYAWYRDNADRKPHPVGQKQPNGWGLYDMLGNVREWTADWYAHYPHGARLGPRVFRVNRGGSWHSAAHSCRAARRPSHMPDHHDDASASAWRAIPNPPQGERRVEPGGQPPCDRRLLGVRQAVEPGVLEDHGGVMQNLSERVGVLTTPGRVGRVTHSGPRFLPGVLVTHRAGLDCPQPKAGGFSLFCAGLGPGSQAQTGALTAWSRVGKIQMSGHGSP